MGDFYIPIIVMLLIIGAMLREDFVFTILYLFIGAYALGRWWSRRALSSVDSERKLQPRAFLGEEIKVELEFSNASWLPVVWLRVHEALPVELAVPNFFKQVISLSPHEHCRFEYRLQARKRGYYPIGPLSMYSGDILGLTDQAKIEMPPKYVTVFPKIVPLNNVIVPSRSPMGSLRHHEPILEDPNRVRGKREYVAGDSLRQVDWKSTAATGRLQVKLFEPSISLVTSIFLNLNAEDYHYKTRAPTVELAIVIAASLANWLVDKKQSVGLITNGKDPLGGEGDVQPLLPHNGRSHLMRLLETLARIEMVDDAPVPDHLRREIHHLPWGTTLIVITGRLDDQMFEALFHARRLGINIMLVLCGPVQDFQTVKRRAEHFGFPVYQMFNEQDLDVWR